MRFHKHLGIGPFSVSLETNHADVVNNVSTLYADYTSQEQSSFVDFPITITTNSFLRRFIKPQVDFLIEEFPPFKPLPKDQAYAMFEWGLNYCITTKAHHYLMLHAGVIEKNNNAIIMPAHPGSGKSTLTAALVFNGFRLFSDEIALISLADNLLYPCTKPINLKNESIDVIRRYVKEAVFSSVAKDTHKGTVALLKPPRESVLRMREPAPATYVVFPKYQAGAKAQLTQITDETAAFQLLIEHSFNYHVLGAIGFGAIVNLLKQVKCYHFVYSDFEEAKAIFDELVN